jgi:hypothetical protein
MPYGVLNLLISFISPIRMQISAQSKNFDTISV